MTQTKNRCFYGRLQWGIHSFRHNVTQTRPSATKAIAWISTIMRISQHFSWVRVSGREVCHFFGNVINFHWRHWHAAGIAKICCVWGWSVLQLFAMRQQCVACIVAVWQLYWRRWAAHCKMNHWKSNVWVVITCIMHFCNYIIALAPRCTNKLEPWRPMAYHNENYILISIIQLGRVAAKCMHLANSFLAQRL